MSIRVLHVLESLARGGVETTFLHVLRSLSDVRDMRHDVLAFRDGPLHAAYAQASGSLVVSGTRGSIEAVLARGYDVVHLLFDRCVHRLAPWLLGRSDAAIVLGKNYDLSAMFRINAGRRLAWDESAIAAADAVTFTTPQLAAVYGATGSRYTPLRKAADVLRFSRVADPDAGVPNRLLCVANLHPRKRVADLAAVLKLVLAHVPDAEIQIAGGGSTAQRDAVLSAAWREGVAGRLTLLGPLDDVTHAMAGARALVLPSASEGVPTVLLEAMAAGRPVITARSGHVDHVLDDGQEGWIVAPGDVHAMADRAVRIFTDRALAADMGRAGRARALGHDVRLVAHRIGGVLRAAATGRRWAA